MYKYNNFFDNFFECVKNVDLIVAESYHNGTDDNVAQTLIEYGKKLHIIIVTTVNNEKLRLELLDIMTRLKKYRNNFDKNTKNYKSINSVYDCIRDFYFDVNW